MSNSVDAPVTESALHNCLSASTDSTSLRLCATEKDAGYLWTCAVQTHVVQGLTALSCHKGPIFGYNDTHATLIL